MKIVEIKMATARSGEVGITVEKLRPFTLSDPEHA